MKKIFLLLSVAVFTYATALRTTNFTSEYAGVYSLYSITSTSKTYSDTITFKENQICVSYNDSVECVENDNSVYDLLIDVNGNLTAGMVNNQYVSQNIENTGSIYDVDINQNATITFNEKSFSYCYSEEYLDSCIIYIKKSASQSTPEDKKVSQEELIVQSNEQERYTKELEALEYASGAQKAKFINILNDLKIDKLVEHAYLADNRLGILIDYKGGYSGIITVTPEDDKGSASYKKRVSVQNIIYSDKIKKITKQLIDKNRDKNTKLLRSGESNVGNNKVLAFMAQHWDWNDNDDVPLIANLLEEQGYDVTRVSYDIEGEGKLVDFKNWDKYGIVLISTHGLSGNYKDRTGYGKSSFITLLQTNIFVTSKEDESFHEDLLEGRLYLGSKKYYITQKFITHYNKNFPNSFIYVSACKGAKHDYMANAFLEKNAGAYVSWSDNVKVSFAQENGLNLFSNLLNGSDNSIKEIYAIPDDFNGSRGYKTGIKESDPDREPAELIVFTRNNVKLQIDEQTNLSINTLKNLLSEKAYKINGAFSRYDFEDSEEAFDWVYKDEYGYAQLKGKKATENNVFGWKDVILQNEPSADWYMFSLGEDIDRDGSLKFDWIIVSADENSKAAYKLSGVTDKGTFNYLGPINITYTLSHDKKSILFGL